VILQRGQRSQTLRRSSKKLQLLPQWIDHIEKREPAETGIPRADATDPMLAHENGGVGVMKDAAAKMRRLLEHLAGDVSTKLGRDKNVEAW